MNTANEDTITVEWPNFGQALGHDVWQFYMAKEYSDVTICTEEGYEISGHRIILAMCSPYFRDLFKTGANTNTIVCLSSITHDIMAMILRLIYGGAVAVPACDMRAFMKAAKYLKLPGFEQIPSSVSAKDIQIPRRRNYSIVLKRIDEDGNFAIGSSSAENNEQQHGDTQSNEQPTMTNGDDPNGGDNSSDSSEFGNGDDDNGDGGDHDDHADDGNAGCVKYNTSSNNIVCQTNGYPLSSSSSSESAMSTSDDEHTAIDVDNE